MFEVAYVDAEMSCGLPVAFFCGAMTGSNCVSQLEMKVPYVVV